MPVMTPYRRVQLQEQQMVLNENYYACMANDLILARQKSMSTWANRIINFLVMQLVGDDGEDLERYTVRIKDLADFVGVSSNKVYSDIRLACSEIMQTVVEIGTGDPRKPWRMLHWMREAEYDGAGKLTLALSEEVKPYLIDLKMRGFFTQWQIKEILPMTSFYAIRLYQYITMEMNKTKKEQTVIEMSVNYAREFLECQEKFKQIGQFKKEVLERAADHINKNPASRWYISEITYSKTSRTITAVQFHVSVGEGTQGNSWKEQSFLLCGH